jgi:hypothetical protein
MRLVLPITLWVLLWFYACNTLSPLQAQNLHNMSLKCVRASPIFFEKKMEQAMGG